MLVNSVGRDIINWADLNLITLRRIGMKKHLLFVTLAVIVVVLVIIFLESGGGKSDSVPVIKELRGILGDAEQGLLVEVDAIRDDGVIRPEFTCVGSNKVPRVTVKGVGEGIIALIIYDPDAPGGTFIHWTALARSNRGSVEFPRDAVVEGVNDFGQVGYGGPCPPRGDKPHRYVFLALYVADIGQRLPVSGFSFEELLGFIKDSRIVSWGYTVGVFSR